MCVRVSDNMQQLVSSRYSWRLVRQPHNGPIALMHARDKTHTLTYTHMRGKKYRNRGSQANASQHQAASCAASSIKSVFSYLIDPVLHSSTQSRTRNQSSPYPTYYFLERVWTNARKHTCPLLDLVRSGPGPMSPSKSSCVSQVCAERERRTTCA